MPSLAAAKEWEMICSKGDKVKCSEIDQTKLKCTCCSKQEVECYYGGLFGGRMSPFCICCGDCTLSDALAFGLNIADLILKYLGVAALLLFIYGGVRWIFSGGNPEAIRTGKAVVTGAVTGLAIVLAAFLVVHTVLKTVAPGWEKEIESKVAECTKQYGEKYKCISQGDCSPPIYTASGLCPSGKACCVPMVETECVKQHGNEGYACRRQNECDQQTIKLNLCPGGADIVCCKPSS